MKSVSRRVLRTVSIIGIGLTAAFAALIACSNMNEGERCEFDNGNEDCEPPLICLPATNRGGGSVNPPFNTSDRCCPQDRRTATHPACTEPNTQNIDGGPPADAGP